MCLSGQKLGMNLQRYGTQIFIAGSKIQNLTFEAGHVNFQRITTQFCIRLHKNRKFIIVAKSTYEALFFWPVDFSQESPTV